MDLVKFKNLIESYFIIFLFFFILDDPGGGTSFSPAKILKPELNATVEVQTENQTRTTVTAPAAAMMDTSYQSFEQSSVLNNNITNSSDLKYLHKKFKRIASATIDTVDDVAKQLPAASVVVIDNNCITNAVAPISKDGLMARAPSITVTTASCYDTSSIVTSVISRNSTPPSAISLLTSSSSPSASILSSSSLSAHPNNRLIINDNLAPVDKYVQHPANSFKQNCNSANQQNHSAITTSSISVNRIPFIISDHERTQFVQDQDKQHHLLQQQQQQQHFLHYPNHNADGYFIQHKDVTPEEYKARQMAIKGHLELMHTALPSPLDAVERIDRENQVMGIVMMSSGTDSVKSTIGNVLPSPKFIGKQNMLIFHWKI